MCMWVCRVLGLVLLEWENQEARCKKSFKIVGVSVSKTDLQKCYLKDKITIVAHDLINKPEKGSN